jgi:hypothetical protein
VRVARTAFAALLVGFAALLVGLAGACSSSEDDPCAGATTCLRLEVDGFVVQTIDQLELDLRYAGYHATTTLGTNGGPMELPVSTAIRFDVPGSGLLSIDVLVAARLSGALLGAAGQSKKMIQQGHEDSLTLYLSPYTPCTEGSLSCGGPFALSLDYKSLYRCMQGLPRLYASCSDGCTERDDEAVCFGADLCREGGTYCGGHAVDGDPFTLYVCHNYDGVQPVTCPRGCVVRGDGNDTCE